MKKILILTLCLSISYWAKADDLTAVILPAIGSSSSGSIDLSVSGGAAPFTFSWTGPGGFSASTEDISYLEAGTYIVTVSDSYCGMATMSFVVGRQTPNSIEQTSFQSSLNVFPNPTLDICNISSSDYLKNAVVNIIDIKGSVLATHHMNGNSKVIDLKSMSSGTYIIEVSEGNKTARFKIVKK